MLMRDFTKTKEVGDGWYNFESLDQEAEKLTLLLDQYQLQLKHGDRQVWVATLLPYDYQHPRSAETKTFHGIKSFLHRIIPSTNALLSSVLENSVARAVDEQQFREEIESGDIDGYYCALTGAWVQDCLEMLVQNVKTGKRYTYYDTYTGPGGCVVLGWADAFETDTLGQYLMKGLFVGERKEGQVMLTATNPALPQFSSTNPSFRTAYHQLVGQMKACLTREQLYEAAH